MKKEKHPKLLIVGVGSLRNYGCEGIVHGTYTMFQKFWPECELIVATENPQKDSLHFSQLENISFIEDRKRFTLYRLFKGVLRRFLRIGEGSPVRINKNNIRKKDIFLSCGGDNFCQAPDGSIYTLLEDLMKMGDLAKKKNVFYSLWGASIGPFSKENEDLIIPKLRKADMIFIREKLAYDYVEQLNIGTGKLRLIADPAFCMDLDTSFPLSKKDGEILVGLNISPLAFTEDCFPVFEELLRIDERIKIICIPHVMTSRGGSQDDFSFLKKFVASSDEKKRIFLLPPNLGARLTKGCISQCDMVIAARMHACVAGVSAGISTLFLTYSNKGKGMAQYVYGHQDWVLSNQDINTSNLKEKVLLMLEQKETIQNYLIENNSRFQEDAARAVIELKKQFYKE